MIDVAKHFGLTGRLIRRFCLIGLPVYLVVCLGLITVYKQHRLIGLEEEIAAETAAVSISLADAITPLLSAGDDGAIAAVLGIAKGSRTLRCVEVVPANESALAPVLWPGFACGLASDTSVVTVPIRDDHVILGQVVAHYSTEWATTKLLKEAIFLYWATAIGTLAALIAFLLAYRLVIGRRIAALCEAIRYRQQTGEDKFLEVSGTDPLAEIAVAYNGMLDAARMQRDAMEQARIDQAALAEAAAAARAETEARTRFLESASHELRTPLNGILGAAEILSGTNLTAKQRRCSLLLRDASDRLEGTIAKILLEADGAGPSVIPQDLPHQR